MSTKNESVYVSIHMVLQTEPPPKVTIANPGPLNLCGFALTTFVISCYNTGVLGVGEHDPINVMVGLSLFYNGVTRLLAGMWEYRNGNSLGGMISTSYGAFGLAFATIFIPGFNVRQPYLANAPHSLDFALGIFQLSWTIFTALMLLATLKKTIAVIVLFAITTLTLLLLTIKNFSNELAFGQAAGYAGILTALAAWYNAMASMLTQDNSFFTLPVGKI